MEVTGHIPGGGGSRRRIIRVAAGEEGTNTATYLLEGKYTLRGIRGFKAEGATGRRSRYGISANRSAGDSRPNYVAFGDTDVYAIAEFRDNAAAAAAALAVAAGGGVEVKTVVLRTPSEADAATKKAAEYRAPGG